MWIAIFLGFHALTLQPHTNCKFDNIVAASDECPEKKLTKEELFLRQLNPQMRKIFEGLTPEGKALAMELGKTDDPEEKSEPN